MPTPVPFKIAVPEEKLRKLHQKLLLTEWPDEVPLKEPRSRGTPLQDVKTLVDYWLHSFDWRAQESKLNQFPQFTTDIDVDGFGTYNVHFIHQRSNVPNAIPLIFLHGWPGSFIEVTKILPKLVQGGQNFPAFHVVAPSLIDYGFSQGNNKVSSSPSSISGIFSRIAT
jgi:pimeloyl-ACP methyl ester carboxylesterase